MTKEELIDLLRDPEVMREIHTVSDLDRGKSTQHHTLGKDINQAAPGSHRHDGKDSFILGTEYQRHSGSNTRYLTGATSTVNLDANGEVIITHNLTDTKGNNVTPITVVANTGLTTGRFCQVGTITSTQFTVRVYNNDGTRAASLTGFDIHWLAMG